MMNALLVQWLAVASVALAADASPPAPPRSLDSRLVFERIAAEPEIVTPTGIAVDGHGRVLVIESHTHFRPRGYKGPPADRIRLFEDRDRDGRPECVSTFFEGTRMTMSVAVARDAAVYVATRSAVYRLEDRDGDGRADGTPAGTIPPPIVRLDTPGDYPHNGLSGFAFDFNDEVYFGLGENLGADYHLIGRDGITFSGGGEGGNIYHCRPDGTKLQQVATGFWNPFHMAFDVFGALFAVDNDPDSRPPCRLLHIVDGGDYGYRFRNGRKGLHPFTAWNGELPGTLGMVAGTGEAPSGIVAHESDNLPGDYQGTLLVTSWGDHRIEQYRPEPRGASFRAAMKPIVSGGDDFRPVGIAVAPDGSLYVSDWVDKSYDLHGKGRVWRLRAKHPSYNRRLFVRLPNTPVPSPDREFHAAQDLLAAVTGGNDQQLGKYVHDESPRVRALAVRAAPLKLVDLKRIATADASPLVHAEAMRRLADTTAKDLLLKALESDDPFIRQAARQGLRHSLNRGELIGLARAKGLSPAQRLGMLLVVRDLHRPEARALLPAFLESSDPAIRFAAIQWVGEERLEEHRDRLGAALSSGSLSREVFEATLAALEQLDGKTRDPRDERAGEDYVAAIVRDAQASATLVHRALRILRPDHPALTLSRYKRFLTSPEEAVRIEAVRSLSHSPLAGRFDILASLAEDHSAPSALRAEAVAGLADDAVHRRAQLLTLATGNDRIVDREALRTLRDVALTAGEISALRGTLAGDRASLELVDRLARTTAAATSRRAPPDAPAPSVDEWLARLDGSGDALAGERVFFHARGPGCYRCHQVDGRGGRAGPELSTLAGSTDRRRLVESIVAPNKEFAPQFVAWSVARTDGTIFTGILLDQSPEGMLVFADAEGRRLSVKADEIADRKPQTTSIMPDDLARAMTTQEFRDLIAFLCRVP
jgi:putative membrane-bound dehydrogenase-like protein